MTSLAAGFTRSLPRVSSREAAAWWWAPAALVASALTWPVGSLSPVTLNAFFPVGLHLEHAQGLQPGSDVVFTYGPLGFLAFPLLTDSAGGLLSFAFAAVLHTALVVVVLRVALRRLPWPAALVLAVVAGGAPIPLADIPVVLVLAACVHALTEDDSLAPPLLAVGGGAVAALELLVKLNDGVVCIVLLALAVWRRRPGGLRAELLLGASIVTCFAALWAASGGRIDGLAPWARLSAHLVASYGQGMGMAGPPGDLRFALMLLAATAALGFVRAHPLGLHRGGALWLSLACFCFAFFKEGFVRADAPHETIFFAALGVALLAIDWSTTWLRVAAFLIAGVGLARLGGTGVTAETALFGLTAWCAVRSASSRLLLAPVAAAGAVAVLVLANGAAAVPNAPILSPLKSELRTLATSARRADAIAADRAAVRKRWPLAPALLEQLRGHTVDIEPFGATIAWGYQLDWRPEPVLETYSVYDPALDRFAVDGLTAQRILQLSPTAIDEQNPLWQAPALVLAELCDYRRVGSAGYFTVLAREGSCGAARELSTTTVPAGAWVRVPKATRGEIVTASIHLRSSLSDRARSLLLRAHEVRVQAQGRSGGTYKLVSGTASDQLVMTGVTRFRLLGAGTARVVFSARPLRP